MERTGSLYLIIGAALSGGAALLHLGCIVFGAPWYRFLGAGERMAQMAAAGKLLPTLVTAVIATVLLVWALYALSGAGIIGRMPLLRPALCAITGLYLLRAVAFAPLTRVIPDNSRTFWWVSAGVSLLFGIVHLVGLQQAWAWL